MKLNWVTLRVTDLERSLNFYTNLLSLKIATKFGSAGHQIVMLGNAEDPKIELICEPGTKIENPGKGISFGLETDNLDQLVSALKKNGCQVSELMTPNPQIRFCFVPDPDGYTVQLVEQN